MDLGGASAVSSLIDAGASIFSGFKAASAQKKANNAMIDMAQKQMDWQERMSSTAMQRQAEDLRRAGLNPILALTKGGASTPSGSVPNIQPATGAAEGIARAGSSAGAAFQKFQERELLDAQIEQVKSQTDSNRSTAQKTAAETAALIERFPQIEQEFWKLKYDTDKAFSSKEIENQNLYLKRLEADVYKELGDSGLKAFEKLLPLLKNLGGVGEAVSGTAKAIGTAGFKTKAAFKGINLKR